MFTVALFTIARPWKQPKCPSTEEWIKKMWHIYTIEYYSAINKNERMPFARTWMDLDNVILTEVTQPEKDKCHMISVISVILKMVQMNLLKMFCKYRCRKQYSYQGGNFNKEFSKILIKISLNLQIILKNIVILILSLLILEYGGFSPLI